MSQDGLSEPAIAVTRANFSDAPTIARIHVASWREAYAGLLPQWGLVDMSEKGLERWWRASLVNPRSRVSVARVGGAGVVGFLKCAPARDYGLGLPIDAEIEALYVDPDGLGRGIGTALLNELFAHLSERGTRGIIVWALEGNWPARQFYEKHGGRLSVHRPGKVWGANIIEQGFVWPHPALATTG